MLGTALKKVGRIMQGVYRVIDRLTAGDHVYIEASEGVSCMRCVYVDTENVSTKNWVSCLRGLSKQDVVYLVYTQNSKQIPIWNIEQVIECEARIRVVEAKCGSPNALDFVLVSVLSSRVVKAPKSYHVILSNDKGFDAVVEYHVRNGSHVCRVTSGSELALSSLDKIFNRTTKSNLRKGSCRKNDSEDFRDFDSY